MIRPWLLWRDLQRIVQGTAAFFQHLLRRENIDVGLGLFSAKLSIIMPGRPSPYIVRIANVSSAAQEVRLVIDIYSMNVPKHPEGHYAYFAKNLKVNPRTSTAIEVRYDWLTKACFLIDDVASPPDDLWKGEVNSPQVYSVNATLLDAGGILLDRLTIYQELTG